MATGVHGASTEGSHFTPVKNCGYAMSMLVGLYLGGHRKANLANSGGSKVHMHRSKACKPASRASFNKNDKMRNRRQYIYIIIVVVTLILIIVYNKNDYSLTNSNSNSNTNNNDNSLYENIPKSIRIIPNPKLIKIHSFPWLWDADVKATEGLPQSEEDQCPNLRATATGA